MSTPSTDAQAAVDVIDAVSVEWRNLQSSGQLPMKPRRTKQTSQAAIVLAFASHVHACVTEVRRKLPDDLSAVDYPMLRAILETSLRVIWLDKNQGADAAMMNEEVRQRRKMQEAINESGPLSDLLDGIAHVDMEMLETDLDEEAKHFKQMMKGSDVDLYPLYRLLSNLSHPSVMLADHYLEVPIEGDGAPFALRAKSADVNSRAHTWMVAACYVWVTRVVNYYTSDGQMRSRLRQCARELGIKAEL